MLSKPNEVRVFSEKRYIYISHGSRSRYLFIIEKNKTVLHAYILTKKEPTFDKKANNYKDGFHIHYPNITLSSNDRLFVFNY